MPSNLRSNSQSDPTKRSSVSVAAIGSSQSGITLCAIRFNRFQQKRKTKALLEHSRLL